MMTEITLPEGWVSIITASGFEQISTTGKKVKTKECQKEGAYPVIDQGQDDISGYIDDKSKIIDVEEPVCIFGDHTRVVKWVDFSFVPGADGTKILKPLPFLIPRFAFHQLKSLDIPDKGYSRHFKFLKEIDFGIPPLAEQKVIADKLDTLLAQVESTKARLERIPQILKRFRQSVLAAAVSGKLTEEWRRGNCSEGYIYKFEELLKDKKHLSYGVLKPGDYDVNGVPMLRVMDLGEWGTFSDTEIFKVSKKLSDEFKRTIVDEGDIVLSIMATIGRPAIIPKELSGANVNRALAVIKLSDKVLSKFMLLQLLSPSFQEVFVSKQIGSAQKRINLADLREFDVWVPEINEQAEIVGRVEKLFAYTDTIEQQVQNALARVNNLTQSILAKAFRGELTEQWRKDNLGLISGDNSAEALLEKIKAEREALADQPKKRILAVKQKTGSTMSKGIIKVTEALRAANKPLTGQELMAAAGYPSNSSTEQLEQFFLDVRDALEANQIVKLKRDKNGQDWFSLNEATES